MQGYLDLSWSKVIPFLPKVMEGYLYSIKYNMETSKTNNVYPSLVV